MMLKEYHRDMALSVRYWKLVRRRQLLSELNHRSGISQLIEIDIDNR